MTSEIKELNTDSMPSLTFKKKEQIKALFAAYVDFALRAQPRKNQSQTAYLFLSDFRICLFIII